MSVRYKIMPGYEHIESLVRTIIDNGVPPSAVEHPGFRNRLYTLTYGNELLNIKAFRRPTFPNRYIYTTLRQSKARRSAEHAERLLKLGIDTPAPVAWIEIKQGAKLTDSYYISVESLVDGDLRYWENRPEKERDEILNAYARFMLLLHEQGVLHHDLSPGNIIWTRDERGVYHFKLVDLNRMTFYRRPLHVKQRLSNFRNINSLPDETRRLARLYAEIAGYEPYSFADRAVDILNRADRRKSRLRRLKNALKSQKTINPS